MTLGMQKTKIECPSCEQRELPFLEPESVCENCQGSFVATELRDNWPDAFADKIRPVKVFSHFNDVVVCGSCLNRAMIFHESLKLWMCFNCFKTWQENQLKFCEYCKIHKTLGNFYSVDACKMCWEYYSNYDKYKSAEPPPAWMWNNFDFVKDKIFW